MTLSALHRPVMQDLTHFDGPAEYDRKVVVQFSARAWSPTTVGSSGDRGTAPGRNRWHSSADRAPWTSRRTSTSRSTDATAAPSCSPCSHRGGLGREDCADTCTRSRVDRAVVSWRRWGWAGSGVKETWELYGSKWHLMWIRNKACWEGLLAWKWWGHLRILQPFKKNTNNFRYVENANEKGSSTIVFIHC